MYAWQVLTRPGKSGGGGRIKRLKGLQRFQRMVVFVFYFVLILARRTNDGLIAIEEFPARLIYGKPTFRINPKICNFHEIHVHSG